MAATNKDWPRGFWPAKTKHGGPPQVSRYYTSADDTLYRGDLVIISSTATQGNVRRLGGNTDGDLIIGVCQTFTTYGSGGQSIERNLLKTDRLCPMKMATGWVTSRFRGLELFPMVGYLYYSGNLEIVKC